MAIPSWAVRLSRHAHDLDADGHHGAAASAALAFAELNANQATNATPNTVDDIDFDTLYDADMNVVGSLPAGLGLTYSTGVFTLAEDGVWDFRLGADQVVAPGSVGEIKITPSGYATRLRVAASGNLDSLLIETIVTGHIGDVVEIQQSSAGSSVNQIDGYAIMSITRLASAIS